MGKASKSFKARQRRALSKPSHAGSLPAERVSEMVMHAASGAAGIHEDQKAKQRAAAGKTNRVGSRSSAKRAVLSEW